MIKKNTPQNGCANWSKASFIFFFSKIVNFKHGRRVIVSSNLPKFLMWDPAQATLDRDFFWKRYALLAFDTQTSTGTFNVVERVPPQSAS